MIARVIDCSDLSGRVLAEAARKVQMILHDKNVRPGLVTIIIGDNSASHIYIRNKITACEKAGIRSTMEKYPENTTEKFLLERIRFLNQDSRIHGILVQMPLPKHISSHKITQAISPRKDVDGFHVINAGLMMVSKPFFKPCTSYGILKILEYEGISLKGKNAVVIGSSNIVGRPTAILLLNYGATVTICNSKTKNLEKQTEKADILISATGVPKLIHGSMIKPGSCVIDVGINRNNKGKLCGDVDFYSASKIAGAITPVPGGVGLLTVAMLLTNTVKAARLQSCNSKISFPGEINIETI